MIETETAAAARVYVRCGWSVFPLWWVDGDHCACPNGKLAHDHPDYCGRRPDGEIKGSPGKHPLSVKLGPGRFAGAVAGVKDATRDEIMVAAWWGRWPLANVGLPAGDNGLAILDVDVDKGGAESLGNLRAYLTASGRPLPRTLTVVTGSGGFHYYYRAPEGGIKSGSNVFGPDMRGLDTRGRGGYVVAPPSNHASGRPYDWEDFLGQDEAPWPDILTRLMSPPPPPRVPAQSRTAGVAVDGDRYGLAALDAELGKVRGTLQGGRNAALNHAAFRLGQLVAGGMLDRSQVGDALLDAARSIGLSDVEATKTIKSGFRSAAASPRRPQVVGA